MKNLFALLVLSLCFMQLSFAQVEVVESFKVSKHNKVDLKLPYAKDIKVETWNKNEVEIIAKVILSGKSTDDGFSIKINKSKYKISVTSELDYSKMPRSTIKPDENGDINHNGIGSLIGYENGQWLTVDYDLVYEIKVPEYLAIDLCTNQGNVEVIGLNAPIEIITNNGFIDVARHPSNKADVKLVTRSGEIFTDFDIDYDQKEKKRNTCEMIKVKAAINGGGGDDISLTSTCGNIYFRKSK